MDKFAAALIFFTRLPLWRIYSPSQSAYSDVVVFWPFVGWLTGGITALVMFIASFLMAWPVAVVVTLAARLLLTGALHEDGLADFCDGFGGGNSKDRILAIMKDSHIGTYGVIGLSIYFLILYSVLSSMPPLTAPLVFLSCDPFCKLCASRIVARLPYARPEGAKNGISYSGMPWRKQAVALVGGVVPIAVCSIFIGWDLLLAMVLPIMGIGCLIPYLRKKIGGYTGDCCGAAETICEAAFLVAASMALSIL